MDNETAKGYLMSALNYLIKEKELSSAAAQKVMNSFHCELDLMTEGEARRYYIDNYLLEE